MKTQVTILLAASASGKTTWYRSLETAEVPFISLGSPLDEISTDSARTTLIGASTGKSIVFDGDFLIWAASLWPTEPGWWSGRNADHIGFHNLLTIKGMIHRMIVPEGMNIIVVFNGAIWPMLHIEELYGGAWAKDVNYSYMLVEVPEHEHRKYVDKRIANDAASEGSYHGFPRHWRDANNNRIMLRNDFLTQLNVQVSDIYESFDEALAAIEVSA